MSIQAHMIGLLSSVGGVADSYAVGGNSPDVVADFVNEYYRVGGTVSDFPTMFSGYTTRSDLATMVDSDGNIKWCPHNYAQIATNANWQDNSRITSTDNNATAPDGTTTATLITEGTSTGVHTFYNTTVTPFSLDPASFTLAAYFKAGTNNFVSIQCQGGGVGRAVIFNLGTGAIDTDDLALGASTGITSLTGSITSVGSGWYLCKAVAVTTSTAPSFAVGPARTGTVSFTGTSSTMYVWGLHAYRSSLGGMVDVPTDMRAASGANFATYVPTTTAAKFLQRRGNHVYNGSSWVNKGIQIETEARTNIATYSNIAGGYWSSENSTTATLDTTGPDGVTNSAITLADSGAGGTGVVSYRKINETVATSTAYTLSVWAKAGGVNYLALELNSFTTPANGASYFNLSTGSIVSSGSGQTTRMVDYGGGWYRCSITFTTDASDTTGILYLRASQNGTSATCDLDGTSSIKLYGAQFEAGSTPSSYIPTSGSTVSRAADSLQIPAANMSASTTAMSLQMDGTITYADEGAAAQQTFLRWQTDANNYISIDLDTDSTDTGQVNANQAVTGTVDTVVASAQYSPGVNVAFNIASRHTSGAINVAKDGTAATADTTPASLVDLSARNCELFQDAMGNIGQVRQWDVDLGDSGIATAST